MKTEDILDTMRANNGRIVVVSPSPMCKPDVVLLHSGRENTLRYSQFKKLRDQGAIKPSVDVSLSLGMPIFHKEFVVA